MLAMSLRAPRGVRCPTSSLTTIAGLPAKASWQAIIVFQVYISVAAVTAT
ncbi:hypothetical protein SAMN04490206_1061 [Pseudomonas umsongensis]|nr:hypothetical protein SAMN04490206_1061 [Pseudomonas umsongensis]